MSTKMIMAAMLLIMALLIAALVGLQKSVQSTTGADRLVLYCAAGIKKPVDQVIDAYQQYMQDTHGRTIHIEVEYGGSGTLLSLLQVRGQGDLYLAGDHSYIELARQQKTVREAMPLARMKPVIALAGNVSKSINSLRDLVDSDLRIAIGLPEGTAIGKATKKAVEQLDQWDRFISRVEVTKPTVNDLAMDLKLAAVDAAIIWNVTARQFELDYISDPILNEHTMLVSIGVLSASQQSAAALHFARFMAAPQKGARHFQDHHFDMVEGDDWADVPQVNFFGGGVNRRALEPILAEFEKREGVRINTVFQGCGSLNAQMSTVQGQKPAQGFPDGYLTCDVYYLEPVRDWFQDEVAVSSTRIVIVTAKGNPHNIQRLEDLTRPGLRIVVSHPTHSTLGGLTERMFRSAGLYDRIMANVVEQQPSSGYMVPPVVSGAADASLAFYTDTLPQRDNLHVVELPAHEAQAVQTYGIARTTRYRHLMSRLYEFVGQWQQHYEMLGFGWEAGRSVAEFEIFAPTGARSSTQTTQGQQQ